MSARGGEGKAGMSDYIGYDDWRRDATDPADLWAYGPRYAAHRTEWQRAMIRVRTARDLRRINDDIARFRTAAQRLSEVLAPALIEISKKINTFAPLFHKEQVAYDRSRDDLAKKRRELRRKKGRL